MAFALVRWISAKFTALTVSPPFQKVTAASEMIEDTAARYKAHVRKHVDKTLDAVSVAARAAGVACEMVYLEHGRVGACGIVEYLSARHSST
ncbi:hypothetical protein SBBP2_2980002 [Burkholderiales bacterium]|nr:hypothetical protein SBBP2_2980002 [Burkholderiales bacterium]